MTNWIMNKLVSLKIAGIVGEGISDVMIRLLLGKLSFGYCSLSGDVKVTRLEVLPNVAIRREGHPGRPGVGERRHTNPEVPRTGNMPEGENEVR